MELHCTALHNNTIPGFLHRRLNYHGLNHKTLGTFTPEDITFPIAARLWLQEVSELTELTE